MASFGKSLLKWILLASLGIATGVMMNMSLLVLEIVFWILLNLFGIVFFSEKVDLLMNIFYLFLFGTLFYGAGTFLSLSIGYYKIRSGIYPGLLLGMFVGSIIGVMSYSNELVHQGEINTIFSIFVAILSVVLFCIAGKFLEWIQKKLSII